MSRSASPRKRQEAIDLNRKRHQDFILKTFGIELIEQKRRELCLRCTDRGHGLTEAIYCRGNLLPITTKGEDCPYFRKQEG